MSHTEFNWQNANGQRIFAQAWKPDGETRGAVVLVHGLGEHTGRYQHVAETLNAAGYALTGFDLPGHGRSEGTRGHASYNEILLDIDRLLADVKQRYPTQPCFLYGHSLGGALVLYYALKRRPTTLAGVIATSPGLAVNTPVPAAKRLLAKVMSRLYPAFTMNNGLDWNYLSRDPSVAQRYKSDPLVHDRISARLGWDLLSLGPVMQAHAAEFPVPLLLVQGSADRLVSPAATAAFAKAVPADKLTYKVWEGFYHETHNEPEKQQVLQTMVDWLDQRTQMVYLQPSRKENPV